MINGIWLSINEYSTYRDISISTIRRYIKAKRVQYKLEDRKYYIYVSKEQYERRNGQKALKESTSDPSDTFTKIASLEKRVQTLEEENSELKMLVELYEGQLSLNKPPAIPEISLIC